MLPHAVYDSPAFAMLAPIDIAVLLLLIRKHNGRNNGDISLGLREVTAKCRFGKTTAARALDHLQEAGLIHRVRRGHLVPDVGRANVASRWRLNFVTETETVSRNASKRNSRDRGPETGHQGVPPQDQQGSHHRTNSTPLGGPTTGPVYRLVLPLKT